jgi:hypothetical protein
MRRIVLAVAIVAVLGTAAEAGVKRRQTAQLLSGVGTGVSGALIVSSIFFAPYYGQLNEPLLYTGLATSVVTPSLGNWYAGEYLTWGMAVRAAAAGLGTYAVAGQYQWETCANASSSTQQCKVVTTTGVALLLVAAIAYVGGAAYDVKDAPDAVDRYNERHGSVQLTPTAMRGITGAPAPGLAIVGRF